MGATQAGNTVQSSYNKLNRLGSQIATKVDAGRLTQIEFEQFLCDVGKDCQKRLWWPEIKKYLQAHANELYESYCALLHSNSLSIGLGNQFLELGDVHAIFTRHLKRLIDSRAIGSRLERQEMLKLLMESTNDFVQVVKRLQESVRQFRSKENNRSDKAETSSESSVGETDFQQLSGEAYGLICSSALGAFDVNFSKHQAETGKPPTYKHYKRLAMFLKKFSSEKSSLKTRKAAISRLFEYLDELDGKLHRQLLKHLLAGHPNPQQCYTHAYVLAELGNQDAWRIRIAYSS